MGRAENLNTSKPKPAKFYAEWKDGAFVYWDKEQVENITLDMPINLIYLNHFVTIKGFDGENECGIFSNEVKDISKEELTVKSFKGGLISKGLYGEIKERVKDFGGKYCQSVYFAHNDEIVNLQLKGLALGSWIEFMSDNDIIEHEIVIKSTKSVKKFGKKFDVPVFEQGEKIHPDKFTAVDELEKTLKNKLAGVDVTADEDEDDIGF